MLRLDDGCARRVWPSVPGLLFGRLPLTAGGLSRTGSAGRSKPNGVGETGPPASVGSIHPPLVHHLPSAVCRRAWPPLARPVKDGTPAARRARCVTAGPKGNFHLDRPARGDANLGIGSGDRSVAHESRGSMTKQASRKTQADGRSQGADGIINCRREA